MSESKMVSMVRVPESEYLALRQDNERLRGEVEAHRNNDVCSFCKWTNTGCLNIGEPGKPLWICHGCVKRQHTDLQHHKDQLATYKAAVVEARGALMAAQSTPIWASCCEVPKALHTLSALTGDSTKPT